MAEPTTNDIPTLPQRTPGAFLTGVPDGLDFAIAAQIHAELAERITAGLAHTPIYDEVRTAFGDPLVDPIPLTMHGDDCCWCCRAGQPIHLPDDPCCKEEVPDAEIP